MAISCRNVKRLFVTNFFYPRNPYKLYPSHRPNSFRTFPISIFPNNQNSILLAVHYNLKITGILMLFHDITILFQNPSLNNDLLWTNFDKYFIISILDDVNGNVAVTETVVLVTTAYPWASFCGVYKCYMFFIAYCFTKEAVLKEIYLLVVL